MSDGSTLINDRLATALKGLHKASDIAQATYQALRELSADIGQNPDIEVLIRKPGEDRYFSDKTCWVVAWESGPYEWAVPASFVVMDATGKLCEPYYSFDLCFYPSED